MTQDEEGLGKNLEKSASLRKNRPITKEYLGWSLDLVGRFFPT
ncbi:hypothetical protein [Calothrix sp. NIES-2100]